MFEAVLDRLGGPVGGARPVEVRQDVCGSFLEGASGGDDAAVRAAGTPWLTDSMSFSIDSRPSIRSSSR